jgi:transmembrane sensor
MIALNRPEDFLENDLFRAWVRNPDSESSAYWEKWLEQNPAQRPQFELAVAVMLSLKGNEPERSDDYIKGKVSEIGIKLAAPRRATVRPMYRWTAIAASIAMVLGLGWFGYNQLSQLKTMVNPVTSIASEKSQSFINTKSLPLLVNLPDGSSVVLSKGSRLDYTEVKGKFPREVRLLGEGFFEITKDPTRPFSVYTEHLKAHVLGTSFLVRSYQNEPRAIVSVRTGQVSVTPMKKISNTNLRNDATLLQQNEQLSLIVATDEIIRETLTKKEHNALPELMQGSMYVFHLKPVGEIFDLLEKAYGIPIDYDASKLSQCTLTASLADEPFLDKIRMICIGIESNFQLVDDRIVITGDGCNTGRQNP